MCADRLIDQDLLPALLEPARQADYPRDSRAFVRIDTSLRVYWHTLFDICPGLLALAPPDGLTLFRPWMAWAAERQLPMDWTFYLWVSAWLEDSPFAGQLSDALRLEMLAASAARWAMADRSRALGIALASPRLPGLLMLGWKNQRVDGGREVELLELDAPLPAPPQPFGWFVLASAEQEDFPGWRALTA